MGDLSRLKLAIGQIELTQGCPSADERATDRMMERALDAGADALVVPNSLVDGNDVRLIGLNDTRIDISGNMVMLEAQGRGYRIGVGPTDAACDFCICTDLTPYTIVDAPRALHPNSVVVRPVGILESGQKVVAFDGGSKVIGSDGQVLMQLGDSFEEDFAVADFLNPHQRASSRSEKTLDALIATIRRFDAQVLASSARWVIGLSGGLDSSITACLLAMALGPDRVVGYNMATRYNTDATKSNAAQTAESLDIALRNGSIEGLVVALGNTLVGFGYPPDALNGVALENAQARTRGNLLSTFAALEGGVVVNNGNRVECAMGYATLYGDAIGALSPIGDLTKVQLFELARQINKRLGVPAVPENLLPVVTADGALWQTRPSAELSSGQVDPMKWFYHDWLVARLQGDGLPRAVPLYEAACDVMEDYMHTRLAETEAGPWMKVYGLEEPQAFAEDLQWVLGNMRRAAFKRIQAPPAIKIASAATVNSQPESQGAVEPPARFNALMKQIKALGRA